MQPVQASGEETRLSFAGDLGATRAICCRRDGCMRFALRRAELGVAVWSVVSRMWSGVASCAARRGKRMGRGTPTVTDTSRGRRTCSLPPSPRSSTAASIASILYRCSDEDVFARRRACHTVGDVTRLQSTDYCLAIVAVLTVARIPNLETGEQPHLQLAMTTPTKSTAYGTRALRRLSRRPSTSYGRETEYRSVKSKC